MSNTPQKINPGEDIAKKNPDQFQPSPNKTPNVNEGQPTPGLPGKDPDALKKGDDGSTPPKATLKEFSDEDTHVAGDPNIPAKQPKPRTKKLNSEEDAYHQHLDPATNQETPPKVREGHEREEIIRLWKGGERRRAAEYVKYGLNLQGDALDDILKEIPDLQPIYANL